MEELKYGEKAILEAELEPWENPYPDRDYLIEITFPEFTCLCPRSGYPDFATIHLSYIPDRRIVELRSLKLWLNKFRNRYISHEAATNEIFDALWEKLAPRYLKVVGDFHPRGNVHTVITVERRREEESSAKD
ncbi:MAG: NADPH-dependent 7-cyano-7-deazaguanine reductase QueF [Thermodesulfobacteria bacterium]|nr:NADPH-dependent 7-cyano-7-deazaguanine reductase QueF [Thermodesulfobacteriota bacterium]